MKAMLLSVLCVLSIVFASGILWAQVAAVPGSRVAEKETGEVLTLAEAVAAAQKRNLGLRRFDRQRDRAEALARAALTGLLPVVSLGLNYEHLDHADQVDLTGELAPLLSALGIVPEGDLGGPLVVARQDVVRGTATVSVSLVNATKWVEVSAARWAKKQAEVSFEAKRQQLLMSVIHAFFTARMAAELVDLHRSQLDLAVSRMEVERRKAASGHGLPIDLVRAETDWHRSSQALARARLAFHNARDVLGEITGIGGLPMPSAAKVRIDKHEGGVSSRERPDVEAARLGREMSRRKLVAAKMDFVPVLSAGFSAHYLFTQPPEMGSQDRVRWIAHVSLAVPLFDFGHISAMRGHRVELQIAELELMERKAAAAVELRRARRAHKSALLTVAQAIEEARLAESGQRIVDAAFAAAQAGSLEQTEARRAVVAARTRLATARLKAQIAAFEALLAEGVDLGVAF